MGAQIYTSLSLPAWLHITKQYVLFRLRRGLGRDGEVCPNKSASCRLPRRQLDRAST